MTRRACDQCHGTDTQYECERGQCYAEEMQRQQEQHDADMDRRWREEQERDQ